MVSSKGTQVLGVTISLTVVAILLVALRLYLRFVHLRNAGREDFFLTLALAFAITLTILIGRQVQFGMGFHVWELSDEMLLDSLKPFWGSIWVYYLSLTCTKLSMLFQYLRLFPNNRFQIAAWIMMAVIICYGLFTFFNSIFLCSPVAFFWDKSIPGGKCVNQFVIWFTNAGLNIATDIAIVILPMPVLASLKLPKYQKRLLFLVFGLGGFVCVVSILRLQSLVTISNSTDPTYDNPPAAMWSSIETTVGIICASLPSLKPLLQRMFPRVFTSSTNSRTRSRFMTPLASGRDRASRVNFVMQNKNQSSTEQLNFDIPSAEEGSGPAVGLKNLPWKSKDKSQTTCTVTSKARGGDSQLDSRSSGEESFSKDISISTEIQQTFEPGPRAT